MYYVSLASFIIKQEKVAFYNVLFCGCLQNPLDSLEE